MITIEEQAAAVEISAVNLRGHIENLEGLVERNRRTQAELEVFSGRLPALDAAAVTLRWLARNEASVRKAVA